MSIESIIAGIVAVLGVLAGIFLHGKKTAETQVALKQARKDAAQAEFRRAHIEKEAERAKVAKANGAVGDVVSSDGMSDAEFEFVFGYKRPHSNS